jgi:hypothetical protein
LTVALPCSLSVFTFSVQLVQWPALLLQKAEIVPPETEKLVKNNAPLVASSWKLLSHKSSTAFPCSPAVIMPRVAASPKCFLGLVAASQLIGSGGTVSISDVCVMEGVFARMAGRTHPGRDIRCNTLSRRNTSCLVFLLVVSR